MCSSYTLNTKTIFRRTRLQYCADDTDQYLWLFLVLVKKIDKCNQYYSPVSNFWYS